FPLLSQGVAKDEIKRRVEETAKLLRIDHLLDKSVNGLAGGDRQRVALGRAIVRRPLAFLMDEPLGTLDAEFRDLMCKELRALHERIKATTVYVTHDQIEAMSMADHIAIMNHGTVEQLGTPREIYDRPATMYVADFIGSPPMNFMRFSSALKKGNHSVSLGGVDVKVPEIFEDASEGELALGVRPEHIRFNDSAKLRGGVLASEYMGTNQVVSVETLYGVVKARIASDHIVKVGDTVGLELNSDKLSLFNAKSGKAVQTRLYMEAHHG
ncbi:MAG: ABC transporter ATP-binding protein, partial [Rhizobiaceae bacterium]